MDDKSEESGEVCVSIHNVVEDRRWVYFVAFHAEKTEFEYSHMFNII